MLPSMSQFCAIVRPEPTGSIVAATRGSLATFFIQGMNVNSHFFHYWHGMTVFIRGVIIVVVVVKWSYFPRPAVSVYLRVTNRAFPQCLWIKQEVTCHNPNYDFAFGVWFAPKQSYSLSTDEFPFFDEIDASVRTRDGNENKAEREKRQKADLSENCTVTYSQKAFN